MNRTDHYPMLVVDVGNSSIKIARILAPDAHPEIIASLAHSKASTLSQISSKERFNTIYAASVVPSLNPSLSELCPAIRFINPKSKLNFETHTDRDSIGADRLANIAAAAHLYTRNVLVVDFGTATTFDLLNSEGIFTGGAITLGLRTMASALSSATALLPEASLDAPQTFAGRNTYEALNAGIVGGFTGLIQHLLNQLAQPDTRIIFTGGDANHSHKLCGIPAVVDPLWTLRGIAILAELVHQ